MDNSNSRQAELEALALRLGVGITEYSLFDLALTHASAAGDENAKGENYESLEFVGDAALGLAVAHYLFEHVPGRTPGEYSKMRASIVNRRALARIARRMDLAPAIRLGRGEELSGGRQRKALLADCLEALIGAIYLDRGLAEAKQFVVTHFADELAEAGKTEQIWDFRSQLQQYCQAERIALPRFDVVRSSGPDHRKEFEVEVRIRGEVAGRGSGHSKKEAEQQAARMALEHEQQSMG